MRLLLVAAALCMAGVQPLDAQQPAGTTRPPADRADTTRPTSGVQQLLPEVSAVGDFLSDLSPDGSTQLDRTRLGFREVELALQATLAPRVRGDVFLGFSAPRGGTLELAYLTATSLPWRLETRVGRFLLPFGQENTTHRHDLHTVEHPYVIQRFLDERGARGTGIQLGRAFAPFGPTHELIVGTVDALSETRGLLAIDEPNRLASGLGYFGRLRNYGSPTPSVRIELSLSAMTGRRLQPLIGSVVTDVGTVNAVVARQSTLGADLTLEWRSARRTAHRSFLLQSEVMHQINEGEESLRRRIPLNPATGGPFYGGPVGDYTGGYLFARGQLTRHLFLGARGDRLQDPLDLNGAFLSAGSGYLELFPNSFSRFIAAYEHRSILGIGEDRVLLQLTFALGPHRPRPF